jgi:hypothetical protein
MKSNGLILIGLITMILTNSSCDGEAGLEGIVINSQTGERLNNVNVSMTSYYETVKTVTDENGFFTAYDFYSCGIKKCDDSFTVIFEKEGYKTLQLGNNYLSESETGYLDDAKKDTVTYNLTPIEE